MSPEDRAEAAKADAARAEEAKARAAKPMTREEAAASAREHIRRFQEVYKATGNAFLADAEARKAAAALVDAKPAAPAARRPTFTPSFAPAKAPPLGASANNSRSASLTQHNQINVQGGEARQTAELVMQGQKQLGTFGIEGIKSAIR